MCIDIVKIWFGISWANFVKFCQSFLPIFSFPDDNLSKYQGILTKLTYIDIKVIQFGIANGQISSIFDIVIFYLFIYFLLFCICADCH